MANRQKIRQTFKDTRFMERFFDHQGTGDSAEGSPVSAGEENTPKPTPVFVNIPILPPQETLPPPASPSPPAAEGVESPAGSSPQESTVPASEIAAPQPEVESPVSVAGGTGLNTQSVPREIRDRAVYFSQVDRDGMLLRIKVNRRLPLSNSPLLDVLQSLLGGPNAEEERRGLISLIPPETRVLSAAVRGDTAYVNFSDEFRFNTYGVEGYAAQIRQLLWTIQEFPNIKDVQFLIEGRRVYYLGEGIWIGSPLSKENF